MSPAPTQINQSDAVNISDARDQQYQLESEIQALYAQIDAKIRDFEEQTTLEVLTVRVEQEKHPLHSWPTTIVKGVVVTL